MIACDVHERMEYIPIADRRLPKDQQTVFDICTLSFDQRRLVANEVASQSSAGDEGTMRIGFGDVLSALVRHGVSGWRNLKDRKGAEVKFRRVKDPDGHLVLDKTSLDAIAPVAGELGAAVRRFNGISTIDSLVAETDESGNAPGGSEQAAGAT